MFSLRVNIFFLFLSYYYVKSLVLVTLSRSFSLFLTTLMCSAFLPFTIEIQTNDSCNEYTCYFLTSYCSVRIEIKEMGAGWKEKFQISFSFFFFFLYCILLIVKVKLFQRTIGLLKSGEKVNAKVSR